MVPRSPVPATVRVPLLPWWFRWSSVLVVAALVFSLSVLSAPPEAAVVPTFDLLPLDKWRHFLAYANALGAVLVAPWYVLRRRLEFVPFGTWIRGPPIDE